MLGNPVGILIGSYVENDVEWWTLTFFLMLFGACFGGNITMIGSTANIVALGMLEKRYRIRVVFLEWFGVGLTSAIVAILVAYAALLVGPFAGGPVQRAEKPAHEAQRGELPIRAENENEPNLCPLAPFAIQMASRAAMANS